MSILRIAINRRRMQKSNMVIMLLPAVVLLFTIIFSPTAWAGGIGDVVTEVAKANFSSVEFDFGNEQMTGLGIKMHAGYGDYGNGYGGVTVLGPTDAAGMQAMLSYIDGEANHTSIQTKKMKGCEVREYTMSNGAGVGVILPDYFVTVEIYETGNGAADIQTALKIAQQTLDGLERAGLLSQAAPDIESSAPEVEEKTDTATVGGNVVTGTPLDEPAKISDTMNIAGVGNGPTAPTTFSINVPHLLTYVSTYHWNNARGAEPGTIALRDNKGKVYGPWQVTTRPGQGGVPNAYWDVYPNIVLPAGTYTVIDSDPSTWSQNKDSGGRGMGEVKATPHFQVSSGSVNDLEKDSAGKLPGGSAWSESPAGVGAVGNIPGPSNATEAVVGVAVPGLIATGLGALAGLGGGGGGLVPPTTGTPVYPTGGGTLPGAGGASAGTGSGAAGMAQATNQIGRRRTEEVYAPINAAGHSLKPEPDVPADNTKDEVLINSQDIPVSPPAGNIPGDGRSISTAEAGIFVQPESGTVTGVSPGGGIIIDTGVLHQEAIYTGAKGSPEQPDMMVSASGEPAVDIPSGTTLSGATAGEAGLIKPDAGRAAEQPDSGIRIDVSELEASVADQAAGPGDLSSPDAEAAAPGEERTFNQDGYNAQGFDKDGFDREGFNAQGFDRQGYNREGFDQAGFDREGFDKAGFDVQGFDRDGFNQTGFDQEGFNRAGFDQAGFDREGYNREGFDQAGFDREGFDKNGFDVQGFDRDGFNQTGFDQEGFSRAGFDQAGFDREGFNKEGFDQAGFDREGFDKNGFDVQGFDKEGFNKAGFDQDGFNRQGFDKAGFDKEGFNKEGFDAKGFDKEGFDKAGFDAEGFNREGFDKSGFDREGYNKAGLDAAGYDRDGFNKAGFDKDGYGRNGFDKNGYDREGYDANGYNAKGYNRSGYDAKGYNAQGYDKEGFDKAGYDLEGYGRNGLNKQGYDRAGFDKDGYDREGYNREGFDREGRQRDGSDEYGYGKDGFNENGFDQDGYDREGFNYEGYSRSGYDPWGYDKQGYGKDGYHWSGYNADGYNRSGRHWTENPYEGDSPFNVITGSANPFAEDRDVIASVEVTMDANGNITGGKNLADSWKPTKPPLGEPYPKTAEKYGPKPWDDEIPAPQPEPPAIPKTEDTGVIGPEDPMNTLKNHEVGEGREIAPEGQPSSSPIPEEDIPKSDWPGTEPEERFPGDQIPETQPGNTFDYTDPETGATSTYEYEPGYTGPRHGERQILVGQGDGQSYEIEYNAVEGKWVNTESGNEFNPDRFEAWQNDVAEDKRRAAIDLEKMANRQDANSKAIDDNLATWKNLEQMQKAVDNHNIGEPGGPGDIDRAIQELKNDMLAGREVDKDRMEQLKKIIGNRIEGKTTGDSGLRKEEGWVDTLGYALEANLATAKEVVTGEKADGSISWKGMAARIMITTATGGFAGKVIDGGLTVAEALSRIKDSVDKGESDFRAVSKAIGLVVLGEQAGWAIGKGGSALNKEMLERFPAFTNKAADFIEKAVLKGSALNQQLSRKLGFISKESAESALDKINKRLVEIGGDQAGEKFMKQAAGKQGAAAGGKAAAKSSEAAARTAQVAKPAGKPSLKTVSAETPGLKIDNSSFKEAGLPPDLRGMPARDQKSIQAVCDKYGVKAHMRPTNPESSAWLQSGRAHPKPEMLKAKTINQLDVELGYPKENIGTVGCRKPDPLPASKPANMPDAHWNSLQKRHSQRMTEYTDQIAKLKHLEKEGKIVWDQKTGIIYNKQTMKPYCGDHDTFAIVDAASGKPVSPRMNEQINREFQSLGATQHNEHVGWDYSGLSDKVPDGSIPGAQSPREIAEAIDRKILSGHGEGGEALNTYDPLRGEKGGWTTNWWEGGVRE